MRKIINVCLVLIMLLGITPLNVLANEGDGADGTSLTPPIISTNRIGNQQAIFVDFSIWDMEIENIDVETETDYVLPFITADAVVLVFPENITPTAGHSFVVSIAVEGHDYPLLLGLNGLGVITEMPNTGGTNGGQPNIPPAPPELTEDWFLNQDVINGNLPVADDGNPNNVPTQANPQGRLEVWGGEAFWDNDLEVWNFPQNTLVIRKENQVTGQLLAGARFSVTRVSSGNDSGLHGTVIGEFDTNSSGIIVIAGLDPGFYIVEELVPPTNFTLDTNTRQHVFMRPDDTSVVSVTFSNLPFGSMLITLRCSVTSAPIQNGEFRVTTSNGTVVGTNNGAFWTNLQGEILIPNIRPDSYVITQVTVPSTHVINLVQSTQTLRVNATGEIYRVDFFSDPFSGLLITLRCEVTGQPIQGGEFRVTNSAGNVVGSANGIFFTNLQGEITIPGLGVDSYVVTQLNAPDGFRLGEQNSQTIFVSRPAETYALNFTNEPYSGLIIQNLDGYNGDPLPGVRFRIDRIDDTGNVLIGEHVTDNNGRIELTGLLGSFNITQLDVPNGWEFDAQPTRITHVNAGAPTLVTFHSPRMGSLEITLQDEDGNPLSGGRFEVRRQNGQLVHASTTNQSGGISLPNLGSGWFTVEQIAPSSGFVMTDTTRSVEVTANTVARANFVNIGRPNLVIEKVDTAGNPLQGAEFELRTIAGALVHRATTNNGGIIAIAGLEPGAFTITETRAPQGFVIVEPSRTIEIVAGETLTERFVNYRAANLTIEKVDEDGNPLGGAEFEVRRPNGELIARVTTNNGGVATVNNIEAGTVIIEETRAPQGFVITEPARTITITAGQNAVERFVNYRQPSLVIEKVDTDGNPLANAEFEIRTLGGQLVHRGVTNQGGLITIPYLEPGSYQVIETRAPDGFVITEPARAIEIFAGQTVTERFINHRMPALIVEKVDSDGNPLSGATFEVRTLSGLLVERIVTNQGGMAVIHELVPGSYEIIETIAPQGFALIEGSRAIQIVAGQTVTERFVNPRLATLAIQKVDGVTNAPLQGVVFEISTLGGDRLPNHINNSFEFITDNAGMIRLPNLAAGTWVITETRPLPGYEAAEPVVFAVGVDNEYLVTIRNYRYPDYVIRKIDGVTQEPLAGVQFEIARYFADGRIGARLRNPVDGSFIWTTDNAGLIRIPNLEHGTFVAIETRPLPGYMLADPVVFVVDDHEPTTITIRNYRYSEWNILKLDGDTNLPLAGVIFEVAHFHGSGTMGDRLRNAQTGSFEFTTDAAGIARIGALAPGTYIITETRALPGFITAEPVVITVTGREVDTTVTIRNFRMPAYRVQKLDGDTGEPLAGVVFELSTFAGERIRNPENNSFEFVTGANGFFNLPVLAEGMYILTETRALPGYILADPITFVVGDNQDTTIIVRNYKLPTYTIRKIDGDTNAPLQGVVFEIARYFDNGQSGERIRNPIDGSFEFVTDAAGLIALPMLPHATYVAIETRPLPGYITAEPRIFVVGDNQDTTITIRNYRMPDFVIRKTDGDTGAPLAGVHFEIARYFGSGNFGERLQNPADGSTTFITDSAGLIRLPSMENGTYVAIETRALPGYILAEPTIFTVGGNTQNTTIDIRNFRQGETVIRKIDGDTGAVLPGVVFEIRRINGERVQNPSNNTFEFTTDNAGLIPLGFLPAGTYVAVETRPLDGYTAAEPTTFEVVAGQDLTVVIRNYRQSSLTIRKINSVTRSPIEGVVFQISHPNGQRIQNPRTGFYDFVTDSRGLIFLPALPDGTYWLTETRPASGYHGLDEPILLEINSTTRQRNYLLEVENDPASGLLIIKTDAQTGRPLEGVVFEIRHADGRLVEGSILDGNQAGTAHNSPQLNVAGGFTTDSRGRINLNHLAPGIYHVVETQALPGYVLDTTVHVVTVEPGRQAVLRVENTPLSGLRIIKTDAITGEPIFGVEFMLFDSNGKVVGVFYSDNRGIVEFPALLEAGRYTIRETRPAPGYARDDMPRTVDFVPGRVTEIEWTNMPLGGQLQISKVSGDHNEQNGLPAGTPLAGAIFEIFSHRTGNLVDRIISDHRGMAVSRPLPLGRYFAVEVQAPPFYQINPTPIDFEIEFDRQIVRVMFPNFSANTGVTIDKTGPREAMQGHQIVYDIRTVRNDSTIPLTDFFWRDILPTNAVRADRLVTGTFNVSLRYRIIGLTNRGNEIVIADNLSTTRNNVVELGAVHLGLASDEFLTEFTVIFGQVPAGFTAVERPRVFVTVLPEAHTLLPNGMQFANKVDIGGRVPGSDEWVISNSTTATTIFSNRRIPQSGW